MAIKLPRLPSNWLDQPAFFERAWNTAMTTIESSITNIQQILVDLNLVTITADGALELAQSAIEPGGQIKENKVVTESVAPSNITKTSTFFNDYAGLVLVPGSFVPITQAGITAQVSIATTAFPEQGVAIDCLIAMNRAGGTDDNVTVRCVRLSDNAVMDQEYEYDVQGQNFTYVSKFYDDDPVDSITDTYQIQINTDDATIVNEVYVSGFLTLR